MTVGGYLLSLSHYRSRDGHADNRGLAANAPRRDPLDSRRTVDARAIGLMALLCLTWSMQQITLKYTAADFSPVLQVALRSGAAAVLVGLFMVWRDHRAGAVAEASLASSAGAWRPGMVVGALFALEYLLIGEGLRFTSAAHIAVFLYTAPIFASLGLHWKLPSERLAPLQWVGIALAFGGIALAFLLRESGPVGELSDVLLGDLLGLAGGAAWGATTVVVRTTRLSAMPATHTLLYQLVAAFVLLLPAALLMGQTTFHADVPAVWASLAFQSVVVSFASFLVWFWLLRRYLASRLGVFSFMTPLFGVVLGAWLLAEPIETSFLLGALLVLAGIALVSGHGWFRRAAVPPAPAVRA